MCSAPLIDSFCNPVLEHALLHPAHSQQIIERSKQTVPYAVMALAGEPRIVGDRDFRNSKTFDLEERGQKAMHALEEFQVLYTLAFECAVSAAGVTDLFARKLVAHPIRDSGRSNAHKVITFAACFDACSTNAI